MGRQGEWQYRRSCTCSCMSVFLLVELPCPFCSCSCSFSSLCTTFETSSAFQMCEYGSHFCGNSFLPAVRLFSRILPQEADFQCGLRRTFLTLLVPVQLAL